MKKALIKKTGEILDIVSEYSTIKIKVNFPTQLDYLNSETNVKMSTGNDKEDFYVLSDGKTYEVDDLAVGLDEIRNWKLKNNLNI
jgi:hypothetical protein